jgi:leucyl/phenylalanyl-tRNA--protein transferase
MPIFQLTEEIAFPPVDLAEPDGLLAVGGDLSEDRLLAAYSLGIFPWYSEGSPLLWWSPDPRMVLFPEELKVPRRLERVIRREEFQVTFDRAFAETVRNCAEVHRTGSGGTWITTEMAEAYVRLHRLGRAHSVEVWQSGKLAGGLYGISMGGAFCGESMFTLRPNASKVAFVTLVRRLGERGVSLIDCQMKTAHLAGFGAREVPRSDFVELLSKAMKTRPGEEPMNHSVRREGTFR